MDYILHIIIMLNVYIILCVSTHLLVGMANLVSMGQAAFYGIGAYITVLSLMYFHFSLLPTIVIVVGVNILSSLLIALPSLRLKGDYFILASIGFQLIVFTVLYNWTSVTKGAYGISGIPAPNLIANYAIKGINGFVVLSSIFMLFTIFTHHKLLNSSFGNLLKAMREDEVTLLSLGRNVVAIKIQTFMISAAFISFASIIYASYISYIDPTSFGIDESIFILAAVLIGGTGNLKGPILGAIFVVLLPEALRFVGLSDSIAAPTRQIMYGLCLIIMMRFRPQGIAGEFKFE